MLDFQKYRPNYNHHNAFPTFSRAIYRLLYLSSSWKKFCWLQLSIKTLMFMRFEPFGPNCRYAPYYLGSCVSRSVSVDFFALPHMQGDCMMVVPIAIHFHSAAQTLSWGQSNFLKQIAPYKTVSLVLLYLYSASN